MTTKTLTGHYYGHLVPAYSIQSSVTTLIVAAGAVVSGDPGLYAGTSVSSSLSITNDSVITSYKGFYAIILTNGGTVTNGGGGVYKASYDIYGAKAGILADKASTVTNFGRLEASDGGTFMGSPAAAIDFKGGGVVINGSATDTQAIMVGGFQGVLVNGAAGSVTNFGTITTFGEFGRVSLVQHIAYRSGVYLGDGGRVTNGAATSTAARITGVDGVVVKGAAGTIANFGVITGNQAYQFAGVSAYGDGVEVLAGGRVTNGSSTSASAVISGTVDGVLIDGGGTMTNYGAVNGGQGGSGAGVAMNGGGTLTNLGAINGGTDSLSAGVTLFGGGFVTNGSGANTRAAIAGYNGLVVSGTATVVNFGAVLGSRGFGVHLEGGGTLQNGSSADLLAAIEGVAGVQADASAIVANYGAIVATGADGVHLESGGALTNGTAADTGALVQGLNGVEVDTACNVFNFGAIRGSGYGARLKAGGYLANGAAFNSSAAIQGYNGVRLDQGGTVINFGTIRGSVGASSSTAGLGVYAHQLAVIANGAAGHASALIAANNGVSLSSGSTLDNFGTVIGYGGNAVVLADANSELVVEGGSKFQGAVIGNRGKLVLASGVGTVRLTSNANVVVSGSMPTATFTNFGAVTVGPAAKFTLSGTGYVPNANSLTIAGSLGVGGELEVVGNATPSLSGVLTLTGTLSGAGLLLLNGGAPATIGVGASLTIARITTTGTGSTLAVAPGEALAYAGVLTQNTGTTLSLGTGSTATFTGVGDAFHGTIGGAGSVTLAGGSDALDATTLLTYLTVTGTGTVTANGAITLGAADAIALNGGTLVVGTGTGGASFTGGTMALGDASHVIGATATSTLTNVNEEIIGAGQFGGGSMRLVNQVSGAIVAGSNTAVLIVDTGAQTIVNAGKFQSFGAGMEIKSAVSNSGKLIADGGYLIVDGAVTGSGSAQVGGATLDFAGAFNQNVLFGSENPFATLSGVLELSHSQGYHGTISNFSKTGTTSLDLDDIAFGAKTNVSYSGTTAGGTLTVTDGTHTAHILFAGDYTASIWSFHGDGHGGLTITDPPKAASIPRLVEAMAGFNAAAAPAGSHAASAAIDGGRGRLAMLAAPSGHHCGAIA